MVLKRLLAIFAALVLLLQFTACAQGSTTGSSVPSIQTEKGEEIYNENSSLGSIANESSKNESRSETNANPTPYVQTAYKNFGA